MKPTAPFRLIAFAVNYRTWLLAILTTFNLVAAAPASAAALRLESVGQWPGWQRGLLSQIKLQGDFAYVTGTAGLTIFNIVDPINPQPVGRLEGMGGYFDVSGRYVYLVGGNGLHVVDVSNPTKPLRVGGWDAGSGYLDKVAVSGGYAYVIDQYLGNNNGGLVVLDISNPIAPVFLSSLPFFTDGQNSFAGIKVSNGFAYVANSFMGLMVIDVTNPLSPAYRSRVVGAGGAGGVELSGGRIFMPGGLAGFGVFDLSSPAYPNFIGQPDTSGSATSVAAVGNIIYVADGTGGLKILDITDSENTLQLAAFQTEGSAVDIEVAGGRAYILSQDNGPSFGSLDVRARLEIIDVSNPTSLTRLGRYAEIPGFARGVAVAGAVALLADGKAGLRLINVADPKSPQLLGTYDTTGEALGVAVAGDVAYVADNESGLQILYVKNPAAYRSLERF